MKPTYLIGVDIGTQGTKAVLVDIRGRTRATAFVKSRLNRPSPGVVEEDPEFQFRSVCRCIRTCVDEAQLDRAQVAAIGIDGQMAGIIGIGDDGRHVTPYDSWLDTRCAPDIARMKSAAGEEIIRKTGGPPSFNHGPKILWWKREHPDAYRRIVAFVQPGGYAAMRLCELPAEQAFIDTTYLHFSGFADNVRGAWDADLCRTFGVAIGKLPPIVPPQAIVGGLSARSAARCGLQAGVPLVAGCGDTAASFLACGATREGVCVDVAGTASVFAATTAQFRADVEQGMLGWGHSATPGLWHPYAYINGGGMNIEWFAGLFAAAGKSWQKAAIRALDRLASELVPAADDPLFLPHLGGRVTPSQPDLRGCWAGVTWSHRAAHLYRAVLEGVALEYCLYRDGLRALNPELDIQEVRVTGGGQSSALWNQIKADALETKVVQVSRTEGAPLGAALLAGYGVGLIEDLDAAARRWIKTQPAVRPDPSLAAHYRSRLARYRRLLEQLNIWTDSQLEAAP
jgi:xylulokinase